MAQNCEGKGSEELLNPTSGRQILGELYLGHNSKYFTKQQPLDNLK